MTTLPNYVYDYDWGSGAVGSLIRTIQTSYASIGAGLGRPLTTTITGAGPTSTTTNTYDVHGNLTQIQYGSTLFRHFDYNTNGTLKHSYDFSTSSATNGPAIGYDYSGPTSCGASFPTTITEPVGSMTRQMAWDCNGGVVTSVTDENAQPTTYSYDSAWRVSQTSLPDSGQTTTTYNLAATPPNIVSSSKITASNNLTTETILDGFGRVKQSQITSDTSGTVYKDVTYDGLGRIASVSNPYRSTSDPTYGITSYEYDPLSRVSKITRPDTNTVLVSYTQRAAKVQDEGNGTSRVTRISQSDSLGRVKSMCEVTSVTQLGINPTPAACGQDIAATGFLTSYQYDVLGNVTSVTQGGLNSRTYAYDMLSRLTSETNPESGTTTYTYDTVTAGDLNQRVAPKPNQTGTATVMTSYTYDALHRLTGISYNDGSTPSTIYSYDQTTAWGATLQNTKGRLSQVNSANSLAASIFSYDSMGRAVNEWQCAPVNCGTGAFPLVYGYDYLGDMTSLVNSYEGKTYTYSYDTAARLTQFQSSFIDASHPGTLLTVNQYNPLGQVKQATFGNGIIRNLAYDNRGRLTSQTDGSVYNFSLGYTPDSNILTGNDSINGNWGYTYDDFSRLATSSKTGLGFNYKYDRYGNRWQQNVTTGTGPAPSYTFDAKNHIVGYSYDAAGNLLNDGLGHTFIYDAEGRVVSASGGSGATYLYDAFNRVAQRSFGSYTMDFIFNPDGKPITEVSGSTWERTELYASGMHTATYANGTTYFYHPDWVGSTRVESKTDGTVAGNMTNLAFGDGQVWTGVLPSWSNFAGGDYDNGTGLDLFMFRQYSTTQGRWIRPDPAGLAAVNIVMPQSWNRSSYVRSSPLVRKDPTGLCDVVIGGIRQSSMSSGASGLTAFANSIGASLVFPYAGGSVPGGMMDVAGLGLGLPNSAISSIVAAITQAADDIGAINIFTFSGGAQAFNSALASLPDDVKARINNVTYVSPGAFSDLSPGKGNTTIISNPSGFVDDFIFGGSMGSANLMATNCGHNSNCTFPQQQSFLWTQAGTPCSLPTTFSSSKNTGYFGYSGLDYFDLILLMLYGGESVTHTIRF